MRTKRILYTLALAALVAGPVWAGATIDVNVYWTAEDYSADGNTYDWENPTGNNWRLVSDDSALGAGNFPGATGCTLNFLGHNSNELPDTNLPNAGETFILVLDGLSAGSAWAPNSITDFCGGGNWAYSSLTVGSAEGHNGDDIMCDKDSAVGGTITSWGNLRDSNTGPPPTAIANATITIKSVGYLDCNKTNWAITQPITCEAGGTILPWGATILANGGLNLAGTLKIDEPSSVLDTASPINCTGDCEINWGSGNGKIYGGLNANGHPVTHTLAAAGNSITCDQDGDLDLGTDTANSIAVTVTAADVTLGNSFACGTFTLTSGTLDGADKTISAPVVCAGTAALAGSFACGSFTLNAAGGTLTGGGHTITVAGDLTRTAGNLDAAGTLNVVFSDDANWDWYVAGTPLGTVTINADKTVTITATSYSSAQALVLNGALTDKILVLIPAANDFWTQGAGGTCASAIRLFLSGLGATASNAGALTLADADLMVSGYGMSAVNRTVTFAGAIDTGAGTLNVQGRNGIANTVTLVAAGGLTVGGNTTFGRPDANGPGVLTLASGQTHTFGGTIAMTAGGSQTTNGLNLAGNVKPGGNWTLAGITADFGSARIDTGAVTINGASATAISNAGAIVTGRTGAVTFSNMNTNWTSGNPPILARRWTDGGGNGVRVQPAAPHWLTGLR